MYQTGNKPKQRIFSAVFRGRSHGTDEADWKEGKKMNREILFRGKRLDNSEWVYGIPVPDENIVRIAEIKSIDEITEFLVDPETVGQYTGMRDKYGRKIFEGDIIKISEYPHYCDVVYDIRRCAFLIKTNATTGLWIDYFSPIWSSVDCSYFTDEFEVVGNVFDNPELMKEE